jgi:hypothetical protein
MELEPVGFDDERWRWAGPRPTPAELHGRPCVRVENGVAFLDVSHRDGVVDVELAVTGERGFHGLVWRAQDEESYESFFVRPHQVGNPDAVQYTPVSNGISSWQLYHGPGFWAPVSFPLRGWFSIRVVFAGSRAVAYVADMDEAALVIADLKRPPTAGRVGLMVGGPAIHVARFAHGPDSSAVLRETAPPPLVAAAAGVIEAWAVSDPFAEAELDGVATLDPALLEQRSWTRLAAEPSGLADLSRVSGLREGRDTVFARVTLHAPSAQVARLELGFSDRAVVYLDGRALFRGDDTYRSRDYRFLGSIGWWDTVYLPLEEGENDLVVAVSETFGGWGVQARLPDAPELVVTADA